MPLVSRSLYLAAFAAIAVSPALHAQSSSGPSAPDLKTPPTRDSLDAISTRGRMLHEYDQIAAAASQLVMAQRPARDAIQGYIAHRVGDRWQMAFGKMSVGKDTFYVAYEVTQRADDREKFDIAAPQPARPDTGFYVRGVRALTLAMVDFGKVDRPYNAAILENSNGTLSAYLMPAQVQRGTYLLGGDARYLIDRDGRTILAKRQLHKEILESPMQLPSVNEKPVAGTHTAVLDDTPEDTDVSYVFMRKPSVPETVVTNSFIFQIGTDGKITYSGRRSETLGDKDKASK